MLKGIPICSDCVTQAKSTYGRSLHVFQARKQQPCAMACGWHTSQVMVFRLSYSFAVEKHAEEDAVVHGGEG